MGNLSKLFRLSEQWRHLLRGMERGTVQLSDLTVAHSRELLEGYDLGELGGQPNRLMALILRDFAAAGGKADPDFLNHLAAMFDGGADLKAEIVRPRGGRVKKYDDWAIALDIEARIKAGDKPYIAEGEAAKKAGCSTRAAKRFYRAYLDALDPGDVDNHSID